MLACAVAAFCAVGAPQVPSCWLDAPPFRNFQSITKSIPRRLHTPAEWAGHGGGLHNASYLYVGCSETSGRAETQSNPPPPCEPSCVAVAGRHSPCTGLISIARTADAAGLPNFCKCIGRAASGLGTQPGSISNDELVGPVTDSSIRGLNASAAADLSVADCDHVAQAVPSAGTDISHC